MRYSTVLFMAFIAVAQAGTFGDQCEGPFRRTFLDHETETFTFVDVFKCQGEKGKTAWNCSFDSKDAFEKDDRNRTCEGTIRDAQERTTCSTVNYGTHDGRAPKGHCCSHDDDCRNACNYFVCA
ncbi:hypothetical protein K457DRAFT_36625 [Linnemannia elongata AG-77]|uniref:Uncharacterized protein n=1 Tax=Linnemannia elongata AG-77 TaxID=1314771 RepID=A0A197JDX1_9FUNG|nr:hypothetical protein K457DRAFT_36625 [Linnemannia elongata AG-77]